MSSEAEIRKRKIYRVTFVGFVVNLVLSVLKLAAGIVGRSGAMVADAVHSFSDLATDVVVIAFARISAKPRDDGHDYGPREVRNPRHDHHKPRAGDRGGRDSRRQHPRHPHRGRRRTAAPAGAGGPRGGWGVDRRQGDSLPLHRP